MSEGRGRSPSAPRLFLARTPRDGTPSLLEEERQHVQVLRLRPGDPVIGIDGRGNRWELRIEAIEGRAIVLASDGPEPADTEPEPGSAGASLPWIELAVSWPRRNRSEAMLGSLVQLGAAVILPLETRYRGPEPCPDAPPERWWKIAREACKQSERAWLPVLGKKHTLEELLARPRGALALLDPEGGMSFDTWLRSLVPSLFGLGSRERPLVVAIGPEGGFAPEERARFLALGAQPVRLGPHVLRVETAAVAAMAVAATILASAAGQGGPPGSARRSP